MSDRNSVPVSVMAPKLNYYTVSAWFRLRPWCSGTNSVSAETLYRNAETVKLARTVINTDSLEVRLLAVGGQGGAYASWYRRPAT